MHAFVSLPDVHGAQLHVKALASLAGAKLLVTGCCESCCVVCKPTMVGPTTAIGFSILAAALPCSSLCICSTCNVLLDL